ncbi:MAG: carbohydrate ABC transporter permease [Pyrinomonadaceae bacterium]|nr:carbohydrate ABC transporter permease [Phycisphaerales bacterium]
MQSRKTQLEWRRIKRTMCRWPLWLLMCFLGLLYVVPLVWMGAVSLKPKDQAAAPGVALLPEFDVGTAGNARPGSLADSAYWRGLAAQASRNYADVWNSPVADFPIYTRNSTLIALLGVIGMVLSSTVVAYGFSRLRWRGRDAVFVLVLATLMIPQAVLVAPQYILFKKLGLIGTFAPLWLPAWFGGAFGIFLLRQFFMGIPRELDEAARIDGCSHWGVFWRIILPLSKPAIIVVALFYFVGSWNDFLGPLVFLNHQSQYTLQLGLQMFQSQHGGCDIGI